MHLKNLVVKFFFLNYFLKYLFYNTLKKFKYSSLKWKKYEKEQIENFKDKRIKSFYKRRSNDVEAPFWDIKFNIWFERFSLRWKNKVKIEWILVCLAHNFKKLINFMCI